MFSTIGGNPQQVTAGSVPTETGGPVSDAGKVSPAEPQKDVGVQITEELQKMVLRGDVSDLEALQEVMETFYETAQNTIDNMKPSEKAVELRRRRLEEIKQLIEECEQGEADFEQALVRFKNMLDPEDVARFESAAVENALIV